MLKKRYQGTQGLFKLNFLIIVNISLTLLGLFLPINKIQAQLYCKSLFLESIVVVQSTKSHLSSETQKRNYNLNKNDSIKLLEHLLNPKGDHYRETDTQNTLKPYYSVPLSFKNKSSGQNYNLVSLKKFDSYRDIMNLLKELKLLEIVRVSDNQYKNPQKLMEELIQNILDKGQIVSLENNNHVRLVFSPEVLREVLGRLIVSAVNLGKTERDKISDLLLKVIEQLEFNYQNSKADTQTTGVESYLLLQILKSVDQIRDYVETNSLWFKEVKEFQSLISIDTLAEVILSMPILKEKLKQMNYEFESIEKISLSDLLNIAIFQTEFFSEPHSKNRISTVNMVKKGNRFSKVNGKIKESKLQIMSWNLNRFILDSFIGDVFRNTIVDISLVPKSEKQLHQLKQTLNTLKPDFIILNEVHFQSMAKFVKDEFNGFYNIANLKANIKNSLNIYEMFNSVLLYRSDLPIEVIVNRIDKHNDVYFTHEVSQYNIFVKNENGPRDSDRRKIKRPSLILFSAHMKSLNSESKSSKQVLEINSKEREAFKSLYDEKALSNPDIPIIAAFDSNRNQANPQVRQETIGDQFKFANDKVEGGEVGSATQIRFAKDGTVLLSEIDVIIANNKAIDSKLDLTISAEEKLVGFKSPVTNQIKLPTNYRERDENISDHFPITSTFDVGLLFRD